MTYNLLVEALLRGNQEDADKYLRELNEALIGYLLVRMRANRHDAEDAAQQTVLVLLELRMSKNLRDIENPGGYIKTILKNEYIKVKRKSANISSEPVEDYSLVFDGPDQLDVLVTNERLEILRECISKMSDFNRRFIEYCMSKTRIDTSEIARFFKITVSNAWSRKFRIIQWLAKCFKQKMSEPQKP